MNFILNFVKNKKVIFLYIMAGILLGALGYASINDSNKGIAVPLSSRAQLNSVYNSNNEQNMDKVQRNQVTQKPGFLSQFDELSWDNIAEPVGTNQAYSTISGSNVQLQRDLDFANGYSSFQQTDMHYNVVGPEQFTNQSMVPFTSRRDYNPIRSQRKLEAFSGQSDYWQPKKEKKPLFEPMKDLTWGASGMPVMTDKLTGHFIPSNKNNNADLPFANQQRVRPGLDGDIQMGRYSVYRINPRNVDNLRSEINQKVTYENVPVFSQKGVEGGFRAPDPTITKVKKPDFREQGFDDLVPVKHDVEGIRQTGVFTDVMTDRGLDQFYQPGPGINVNRGDGPDKRKTKFEVTKKETYLNDNQRAINAVDTKLFNTNLGSWSNIETQRVSTNLEREGVATAEVNSGILINKDKARTTNRQFMNAQPVTNAKKEVTESYKPYTDVARSTIRQTTNQNDITNARKEVPENYTGFTDIARTTIRQMTNQNDITNAKKEVPESYTAFTDDARTTIRQMTNYNQVSNAKKEVPDSYAPYTDVAKTTIRQMTSHSDVTNVKKEVPDGYVIQDEARPTIRQTTLVATPGVNVFYVDNGSYARDINDKTRTTTRQTTLLQDYRGHVKSNTMEGKISHESAENMSIDERREILTYNRPANGKADLNGPYIDKENVKLNEPVHFSYVSHPFKQLDQSVMPQVDENTIHNIYSMSKPVIETSNYYVNPMFINQLKNNPLVNDLFHQHM